MSTFLLRLFGSCYLAGFSSSRGVVRVGIVRRGDQIGFSGVCGRLSHHDRGKLSDSITASWVGAIRIAHSRRTPGCAKRLKGEQLKKELVI